MAKTIKINGVTFTSYFPNVGYKVGYKKVLGGNSGYMLDGSYTEDLLAWKAIITMPCLPLTEKDQQTILNAVIGGESPTVYYFDPKKKGYKTIYANVEEIETTFRGMGGTGVDYWTGVTLVFTEV